MEKKQFSREFPVYTVSIAILFAEIFLFLQLLYGKLTVSEYLAGHFLLVSLAGGIALWTYQVMLNMNIPLLSLLLITFLGPFGAIIALLSVFLYIIYRPFTPRLEDLLISLKPDVSLTLSERTYQEVKSRRLLSTNLEAPLNYEDIISLGTTKQKQIAIAKMLRYYNPSFAPILYQAINDPVSAIRVLAATALNTIDQKFLSAKASQEKVVEESPHKPHEMKKLGLLCKKYAESGILENEREIKVANEAIDCLEKYLFITPEDLEALNALAEIYLTRGRYEEVRSLLKKWIENKNEVDSTTLLNYARSLYRLKEYSTLKQVLAKKTLSSETTSKCYQTLHELKELWL